MVNNYYKKNEKRKSNHTTACHWKKKKNANFFLKLTLDKHLTILTYYVLMQVPVSKLTLGHPLSVMFEQEKNDMICLANEWLYITRVLTVWTKICH